MLLKCRHNGRCDSLGAITLRQLWLKTGVSSRYTFHHSCLSTTGQKLQQSESGASKLLVPVYHTSSLPKDEEEAVVYIHWPYCRRRCTYCNFNKYISQNVNHERMRHCLVKETQMLLKLSGVKRVTSVFFGGGTPSLAEPDTIASILDAIRELVELPADGEIALEANPTSLETNQLRAFKVAGVNRVSVGVQALDAKDLRLLGRDHSVEEALRCVAEAKKLFPGRVSLDLMFGRPKQSVENWRHELREILDVCDHHLSLYQLTLERGTALFKMAAKKQINIPDEETLATMYRSAVEILEENGFERYEVSNFAKEGKYSTHNLAYWEGRQYIGVGPGAHGRFCPLGAGHQLREARIQTLEPDNWMYEVERYGHGTRKIVQQTQLARLEELLLVGLRTKWGISHQRWTGLSSISLCDTFERSEVIQTHPFSGMIVLDNRGLRFTPKGMDVMDSLVSHLFVSLQDTFSDTGQHQKQMASNQEQAVPFGSESYCKGKTIKSLHCRK